VNQIRNQDTNKWRLTGELTFATVGALLDEFARRAVPPQVVDLGNVTRTDSAGLALLIELLKQTKDAPLTFCNMPAQMLNLATVSGVQDLLVVNNKDCI